LLDCLEDEREELELPLDLEDELELFEREDSCSGLCCSLLGRLCTEDEELLLILFDLDFALLFEPDLRSLLFDLDLPFLINSGGFFLDPDYLFLFTFSLSSSGFGDSTTSGLSLRACARQLPSQVGLRGDCFEATASGLNSILSVFSRGDFSI